MYDRLRQKLPGAGDLGHKNLHVDGSPAWVKAGGSGGPTWPAAMVITRGESWQTDASAANTEELLYSLSS